MKSKTELPMMFARGVAVATKVISALLLLAVIFVVLVLPSGPAVFIYNEEGVRVDHCSDSGDNDSFLRRWHCAW